MADFLLELGIIIVIATGLGYVVRLFKQPVILAYILAGILIGPLFLNLIESYDLVNSFSQLGVAFLLFLVGLSMNSRVMKEVGKISAITGIGQVAFTAVVGYIIATLMGFGHLEAFYVSIALTFSSTIIIVKLLSDKNDLETLYGKISVGFLLVQDFIAIMILILLSGANYYLTPETLLFATFAKGGLLFAIALSFSRYVFPMLFEKVIAKNQDLLFLSCISWLFMLSAFSFFFGFSVEIGAFLAGVSLANLPYTYEITGKIKPLRDFFLVLFFVFLGTKMIFSMQNLLIPALIFSGFVLVGNPLIVMALMGMMGYKKRTGFLAGLTVAQISEFSLVLVALGLSLGHISVNVVSMVTMIGIITITVSTYMIHHGERLYIFLGDYLSVFERRVIKEKYHLHHSRKYDQIIIGYHRMGYTIMKELGKQANLKTLLIDFNPTTIKELIKNNIPCLYGDISDPEIIEKMKGFEPKIIVSTVPTFEDNKRLIEIFKKENKMVFVTANDADDALELYRLGADYVILPRFLGGEKASMLIHEFIKKDFKDLSIDKKKHVRDLMGFLHVKKHAPFGFINTVAQREPDLS